MVKKQYRILLLGLIISIVFWVLDAILDFLVFYKSEGSFLDLLIFKIPPSEIYIRCVAIFMVVVLTLIAANFAAQHTAPEKKIYRGKGKSKTAGLIFLKVAGITFVCQAIIMALLYWLAPPGRSGIILGPLLLLALSTPFLYALGVKPVSNLLQEREEAEEQISDSNQQLRAANQQLQLDIAECEKAEQSLRDSEKKSRTWLEHSPACTKMVDLDFNLQYMSTAGIKDLGIDDITKFYGKPYPFDFYPESFRNIMTKNLKKVKETGQVIT